MKSILLLLISFSFSLTAYGRDSVRCGTSSYYAFSKCSKKKRQKKLKKLFTHDISQVISFMNLLEEEMSLTFGEDISELKKISLESKNYISHLLISSVDYKSFISNFNESEKESFLVYLADCKESSSCEIKETNKVIDRLLINNYKDSKLASEVKNENSI